MPRKNDSAAALSEPMAMQPAIAHQNGRGLWLYKRTLRRRISDFFSSATKSLPRWLFADAEIRRWNVSAGGLDLLQHSACRSGLSPAAMSQLSKRASQKERLSTQRCWKCCAVIVRHAGLPCTQWCSLVFCSEYTVIFFLPSLIRTRAASHTTTLAKQGSTLTTIFRSTCAAN